MKGLQNMKTTQITVEYPTTEHIVLKTIADLKKLGYKNPTKDIIRHNPVNRPQVITVKQVARKIQEEFMESADYDAELEAMCVAQTGMTPSAYQARYKCSWNN